MRAAVCTSGDILPPALWGSLQECDLVIAADGGLKALRGRGIVADLFVGDEDSWGLSEAERMASSKHSLLLPREKDETDTEAAVRAALDRGAHEIWLFGGSGRRMDHWLSNLALVERTLELSRWITPWEEGRVLRAGGDLELRPGTVSVFPLGRGPWKLRSRSLKWPLDELDFENLSSQSNEAGDQAGISVVHGSFLVLLPREGL